MLVFRKQPKRLRFLFLFFSIISFKKLSFIDDTKQNDTMRIDKDNYDDESDFEDF